MAAAAAEPTTGLMYVKKSEKDFAATCTALEAAVAAHKFGVIGKHDIKATLAKKEQTMDDVVGVTVFEVCNPVQAKKVLSIELAFAAALPCRISVYQKKDGDVFVNQFQPSAMMQMMAGDLSAEKKDELKAVADLVEKTTVAIIDESCVVAKSEGCC